ncbi:MAG: lysine--tRNA ligase, partial [Candidatus Heimdallarchaeaceae archaeon]
QFDVRPEPLSTADMYKQGKYDKYAKLFLEKQEEVFQLTEEITGSRMEEFFLVKCPTCKNIAAPQITHFEIKGNEIFIDIHCRKEKRGCGNNTSMKLGDTTWKLKWRLDWAARQDFFGVTVESSGKDHGVAGGSIDTALAIHERIFKKDPLPLLIQHGFLTFGGKKLSGSSGSGMPVSEFPKILDPVVFLYKIYRQNLRTDFDFKVEIDVPKVAAEFDQAEELYFHSADIEHRKSKEKTIKAYELALIGKPYEKPVARVDYGHLITVMQAYLFDKDKILKKLQEQNFLPKSPTDIELELFNQRFDRAKYWLEHYADERIKFSILQSPDCSIVKETDFDICKTLYRAIQELPDEYRGDEITQYLYEYAKKSNLNARDFFKTIYLLLLGKKAGPRAGTLIDVVGKEEVKQFVKEALNCF